MLLRDTGGRKPASRDFLGDAARRPRDLLASAVIERHHQRETIVTLREIFGLRQQSSNVRSKRLPFADNAHAHIALVKFGEIVADKPAQQAHQFAYLGRRTRPVFGAE